MTTETTREQRSPGPTTDGRCTACRYHFYTDIGPGIALCSIHATAPEMAAWIRKVTDPDGPYRGEFTVGDLSEARALLAGIDGSTR